MEILYWVMGLILTVVYYVGVRIFMKDEIEDTFEKFAALFVCIVCGLAWFITLPIIAFGLFVFFCVKKLEPLIEKLRAKFNVK